MYTKAVSRKPFIPQRAKMCGFNSDKMTSKEYWPRETQIGNMMVYRRMQRKMQHRVDKYLCDNHDFE
jgi:hypothetical protein